MLLETEEALLGR